MNIYRWITETTSVEQTAALGTMLGAHLLGGDILALCGDLGAGKTAFSQGVARGMGIQAPVTSPTFTLINRYAAPDGRVMQHVDCYRLGNASLEMWDAGLTDLFAGDDVVLIEWADRIAELLPPEHLSVTFDYLDDTRRQIRFRGVTEHHAEIITIIAHQRIADTT